MEISNGEFGSLDVDWKIHFASTRQVLNITISSMLGTALTCQSVTHTTGNWLESLHTWNGPGALLANLFLDILGSASSMDIVWLRRLSHNAV